MGSLINPVICHHSCACLRHHRHRFAACNACNNTCNNACDAGDRTVLAAAGLPHQQLVDLAAPMLESIPPTPAPAAAAAHGLQGAPKLSSSDSRAVEPASRYVGGHGVLPGSAPHANLILAFEYKGGWRDIPVRVCTCMHAPTVWTARQPGRKPGSQFVVDVLMCGRAGNKAAASCPPTQRQLIGPNKQRFKGGRVYGVWEGLRQGILLRGTGLTEW